MPKRFSILPCKRFGKRFSILPGFGLTLGVTLLAMSLLVLLPLAALFIKAAGLGWGGFWREVTQPRALAAYSLSLGVSLIAAAINAVFGFTVAWVLVRYRFPGRRLLDALVDLPFALPTAVSGIALTTLLSERGWVGQLFAPLGIQLAFNRIGIGVALVFIGMPFMVRTLQPALEELSSELEEASATLGAGRWYTFRRVLLPRSCRRCSRVSRWPSLARSESTDRSSSSRATCRSGRRSPPCSSWPGWRSSPTARPRPWRSCSSRSRS